MQSSSVAHTALLAGCRVPLNAATTLCQNGPSSPTGADRGWSFASAVVPGAGGSVPVCHYASAGRRQTTPRGRTMMKRRPWSPEAARLPTARGGARAESPAPWPARPTARRLSRRSRAPSWVSHRGPQRVGDCGWPRSLPAAQGLARLGSDPSIGHGSPLWALWGLLGSPCVSVSCPP